MKALDEYILMALFVLLLKRVNFLVRETRCDHSMKALDEYSNVGFGFISEQSLFSCISYKCIST